MLWNNAFGTCGVKGLATGLSTNACLQILDLGGNPVGGSVLELKDALCSNTTLHTLGLANASLCEEGGVAMAEVVEGNGTIMRLDLRRNTLGLAGLMAIHLAIKTNSTLLEVALDAAAVSTSDLPDAEFISTFQSDIKASCERNASQSRRVVPAHLPSLLGGVPDSRPLLDSRAMDLLAKYEAPTRTSEGPGSFARAAAAPPPVPPALMVLPVQLCDEPSYGSASTPPLMQTSPAVSVAEKATKATLAAEAARREGEAAHAAMARAASAKQAAARMLAEAERVEMDAKKVVEVAKRAESESAKRDLEARVAAHEEHMADLEAVAAAQAAAAQVKAQFEAAAAQLAAGEEEVRVEVEAAAVAEKEAAALTAAEEGKQAAARLAVARNARAEEAEATVLSLEQARAMAHAATAAATAAAAAASAETAMWEAEAQAQAKAGSEPAPAPA